MIGKGFCGIYDRDEAHCGFCPPPFRLARSCGLLYPAWGFEPWGSLVYGMDFGAFGFYHKLTSHSVSLESYSFLCMLNVLEVEDSI